ncbi:NADH-quinone oxidoreductase subunit M [Shimazuella sp. AN120528]|uniref:complex I subunit 4 family protein n=1 Tax=Shimazuella soli TaxID=1892854 RepID=UPI001F0EFB0E|nr:NADH-quinone oxidoreductase subunit M [Shimazuella soli]MCH5585255.1 NADH-quinone oxidoreductase subunit M [Shimazuella soli]
MGLLSYLLSIPLLGVVVIQFLSKTAVRSHRVLASIFTFIAFVFSLYLYFPFQASQGLQFKENISWFHFGSTDGFFYSLGIDGLSLPLLVLTTLVSFIASMASIYVKERTKTYFSLFLLLEFGMMGVFLASNLFLFFLFFEVTLVTMFFLIGIWGYSQKEKAAYHFLIYNGIGSAFLLIGIVGIYVIYGSVDYEVLKQAIAVSPSSGVIWTLLTFLLIAFAIKLPIFPFHRWMLLVHVEAPPSIVMIHAGILLKMGAYGILRFGVGMFPNYMEYISTVLAVLGLINLLYGAILAFAQQELKSVLAYSSISHMGIVLLGIAAVNQVGLQGAVFQSISHGLLSALFFFLVGALYQRTKSTQLEDFGGLAKSMPIFSGILMVASLGLLGLPGLSGFISEFFSLLGLFEKHPIYAAVGTLGLILAAVYTLRALMSVTFGGQQKAFKARDMDWKEWLPMFVLVLLIIGIGIYPELISNTLNGALNTIASGWRG